MKKAKIYVIAKISENYHLWTDKICNQLDGNFDVFKPKDHNPWNKRHETFSKKIFDVDLEAIEKSHIGLMLPEYGHDCSWEAGYYARSKKPVVVFVDSQKEWLRDWMVKGGVNYVVTTDKVTHDIIKKDPILKYKRVILVKKIKELNDILKRIYNEHY